MPARALVWRVTGHGFRVESRRDAPDDSSVETRDRAYHAVMAIIVQKYGGSSVADVDKLGTSPSG